MVHTGARRVSRGGGGKYFFSGLRCPPSMGRVGQPLLSMHLNSWGYFRVET